MITDLATSGGPAAGFGRATFGALGQLRRLAAMVLGRSERAVDRRSALIAFAVRVTSAAILLVSQVALARWMGVEQFGIYISAWTLVLVLGGIATVGLNVGAIRIVSELREQDAPDALRGFLHAVPLVVGAVAAAVALAATAGIWLLAGWPPSGPMLAVAVILAAVPAFAMTELQDGICRGAGRFASGLLAPYIVRPLLILGGIGALLAAGAHLDAAAAALVAVAATWVAWALQLTMMRRDLGTVVPPGARAYDRMREWSATAAPLAALGVLELTMQNVDVLVITTLLSPTDAGIYFAGAKTMALILFVHYAVGSAMARRFAATATRGDADAMRDLARKAVRWTFWPSLALTAVMLAAGPFVLALFGPRFEAAYPVMCVLAVGILARAAIGPAEALLNMTGGQRDCARALLAAALTNVALSVTLTPHVGMIGAAVALSAALIVGALLQLIAIRRNLGIDAGIWARERKA